MKLKIILGALFILACAALAVSAVYDTARTHAVGSDAVLIEGNCVVINWEASEETWDAAHAKWQALK